MQKANLRVRREDKEYLKAFKRSTWKRFVQGMLDQCEATPTVVHQTLPRSLDESDRTSIEACPSDIERLRRLFPALETHQVVHLWVQMLREDEAIAA